MLENVRDPSYHWLNAPLHELRTSAHLYLYSTLTMYWQRRTFKNERSISEAVHWLALWYSVCVYHVTAGGMTSFTLHFVNPGISTGIELSQNS